MQTYLKDEMHQRELMQLCSTAMSACMMCEATTCSKAQEMDCTMYCGTCNRMMEVALHMMPCGMPQMDEVLCLSAQFAKMCSDVCGKHTSKHCRDCAEHCSKWSRTVQQIMEQHKKHEC